MKKYLILLVLLSGCAAQGPVIEAAIPVAIPCPEPPVVVIPTDPVEALADNASLGDIAKAYRVSRLQWRRLALDLCNQLNAYRRQP